LFDEDDFLREDEMFQHPGLRLSRKKAIVPFFSSLIWRCLAVLLLVLPFALLNQRTVLAIGEPTLTIASTTVNLMNGNTFSVPVSFDNGTHNISAISFSLNFDETCLTFDSLTDSNGDGIPNAVSGLPTTNGYVSTMSYDEDDTGGEIDISMSDQTNPQDALAEGNFTFQFGVQASCRTTDGTTRAVAFAFDSDPNPTFGNTVGAAVTGVTTGGTYTLRFNAYPTDIALTATSVDENATSGTTVGTLSSTDLDTSSPGDSHTYSLVSGTGDTDNSFFAIVGATLQTNAVFNYEADSSYAIRVRTTDSYGGTYEKQFTITIVDVNEAPTSLSINDSDVNENASINTTVGTLSSIDPDAGATAAYSLVAGTGSTDNGSFNISASTLRTSASFNYEVKNTYSVRVRVTDNGSLTLDTIFVIRINDGNDAPVANDDTLDASEQVVSSVVDLTVLTNDTDEDRGTLLSIAAMGTPNSGNVITATSTTLRYTPADYNGVVNFTYTARDNYSGGTLTDTATVSFTVVAADARGDCNSDGAVNAGDFSAIVLENFDADVSSNWYQSYAAGFAGSPLGCDANASKTYSISDLTCTILVFFGNSACTISGVLAAQTTTEATLAVAPDLAGVRNSTVAVPILLRTNGNRVAAASFALDFDESQLTFDTTDADGNGVLDAVTFELPSGMVPLVTYNEEAGRLEVTVYAIMMPMPTLADGPVATVSFQVNEATTAADTPLDLVLGSLGNDQGQSVPVQTNGGSVAIVQQNRAVYLPLLYR
jgi:hypothetical protein